LSESTQIPWIAIIMVMMMTILSPPLALPYLLIVSPLIEM
jgi:hypothetical protein